MITPTLAANALPTLGSGQAYQQPQQAENPGVLQAQLLQQAQQRKLAEALMQQGYVPNSGGLGALAMVLSAYKGKKLAKESDEKVSDTTRKLFDAERAAKAQEAEASDPYNQRMRYLQQSGMDPNSAEAKNYLLTGSMPKKDSRYMNVSPGGSIFDPESGQTVFQAPFAPREAPQSRMQSVSVPQSDGSFKQMNFDPISGQYTDPFGAKGGENHGQAAVAIIATIEKELGRPLSEPEKAQISSGDFNIKGGAASPQLGVKPPAMGTGSEDERKAAGWLDQAQNAFNNMESALTTDPNAAKPGKLETLNQYADYLVPDMAVDSSQSAPRQQYSQASGSFAEAVLRAATGAGVNIQEATQKIKEITPQPFDKPEVVTQKREAMKVYLGSLRSRAGRAVGNAQVKPIEEKAARPRAVNPKTGQAVEWNGSAWVMAK